MRHTKRIVSLLVVSIGLMMLSGCYLAFLEDEEDTGGGSDGGPGVPAAPGALVANAAPDHIRLSWADNADNETAYLLRRSEVAGDYSSPVEQTLPANTEAYDDTSVVESVRYYYCVLAQNSYGTSDASNEATGMVSSQQTGAIVADHTVVDLYDDIPAQWIDEVKTMLLNVPGESHGRAYLYGLELLEDLDDSYAAELTYSGAPDSPANDYLRMARPFWNGASWEGSGGEEDFYTNTAAVETMKDHLTYMRATAGNPVAALGFGWCWDTTWHNAVTSTKDPVYGCGWAGSSAGGPQGDLAWGLDSGDEAITGNSVSMATYLDAVDAYNAHEPATVTFFTTGPVDGSSGETAYQRWLKHEAIREHVETTNGVLFDYADILCWNAAGQQTTTSWNGHTFQTGDPTLATGGTGYDGGDGGCHISQEGCLRLGKAQWWMLARVAGWDGQ